VENEQIRNCVLSQLDCFWSTGEIFFFKKLLKTFSFTVILGVYRWNCILEVEKESIGITNSELHSFDNC